MKGTDEQPTPKGTGPEIAPLVIKDIEERIKQGEEHYGERLKAFNGRDPLKDAYQESLDQTIYLKQALTEREGIPFADTHPCSVMAGPKKDRMTAREFLSQKKRLEVQKGLENKGITVYLSGPMTGKPNFNKDEFDKYAKKYRDLGFTVISPAETDNGDYSKPYEYYIKHDLAVLTSGKIHRVYLLPEWYKSTGAQLEAHVAKVIGINLYDAETGDPYSESILHEAHRLVHTDRSPMYGHPIFDLTRIADIATAVLRSKLRKGTRLEAEDIAKMQIGTKLSRETFMPKRDNRVDAAGYSEVLDMIVSWREKNPGVDPRNEY